MAEVQPSTESPAQTFVSDTLRIALEGWIADHDSAKLERRLWGIVNFLKSVDE